MRSRKLRLAGRPKESEAALREAIRLHEQKGNIAPWWAWPRPSSLISLSREGRTPMAVSPG
jgi:hypothetical protein